MRFIIYDENQRFNKAPEKLGIQRIGTGKIQLAPVRIHRHIRNMGPSHALSRILQSSECIIISLINLQSDIAKCYYISSTQNMAVTNGHSSASGPEVPPQPYTIKVENDTQEKLLADIPSVQTYSLWNQMGVMVPPRPNPKVIPHKWA